MVDVDELTRTLVRLRKKAGHSQDDLARYLGVHQTAVSSYERGRTPIPTELAIAWADRYGFELSVMPTDETREGRLHRLTSLAAELDDARLDALVDVASGLGEVSATIAATLVQLVRQVRSEGIAKGA